LESGHRSFVFLATSVFLTLKFIRTKTLIPPSHDLPFLGLLGSLFCWPLSQETDIGWLTPIITQDFSPQKSC
uniref:Uncharacterized protein n=1 Tax=Aegilops tauschii subsp. strangulata TaxID=200361 RepID=A0A453IXS4_AEGTS